MSRWRVSTLAPISRHSSTDGLVLAGIHRAGRVPRRRAGLAGQYISAQMRGISQEDIRCVSGKEIPGLFLELTFKLTGTPAGVPSEDA